MQAALATLIFLACAAESAAVDAEPGSPPAAEERTGPPSAQAIAPLDLPARHRTYKPYDGSGRYQMDKDDGVRGVQGLLALSRRFGAKPYKDLSTGDGTWQTERVVFQDVDTAATILRYTSDRWTDQLSYFHGNWSADGKYVVFRRRPGMWEASTPTHGPMAVRADGTRLRSVFRQYSMVRGEVCSPTEPNVCYASADGDKKVVAFDIAAGNEIRPIRDAAPGWHLKISPDGKYLMNRGETSKGKGIWIAGVDGKKLYEIAVPEPIHDSYGFHPSQKKIMFWHEGKFHDEGFVQCDFDGSNRTRVHVKFDWNHGDFGIDRGVHCTGFITRVQGDSWLKPEDLFHAPGVESYDDPHDYNGYTSWRPKDRLWSYSTRIVHGPHISELQAFPAEPALDFVVNRYRVCYTGLRRGQLLDNPNASPDGTKVLFNSNFLGSNNIFGVVARLPERPTRLEADATAEGVRLAWQPARHHAETAGYHVYRSRTGGVGFVPLTDRPIGQLSLTDSTAGAGEPYYYAVTAVEHSGLESGLSDEARPNRRQAGRRHLFIEAEEARLSPEIWIAFHGSASDLHYVWMRKRGAEGNATVVLDRGGQADLSAATLWCRVKGEEGVEFTFSAGKGAAAIKAPPSSDWTWVKADAKLDLRGAKELVLSSRLYGSAMDCALLTDDEEILPDKTPRILAPVLQAPEEITAQAISPYAVRLAWRKTNDATFHHYNLYCGEAADFTPDQSTLVASPDEPSMVDWGLKPGSRLYYRLRSVDRFGRRSPASLPLAVDIPTIRRVLIEKRFAERITFEVPAPDIYVVWLLLKKAGESHGYIDVGCDGAGGGAWMGAMDGLNDSTWLSYDQWGRFDLRAGRHVLKIANKTGSKIEKVIITNDLSYTPPGHVNILTGW